jgi:hypothetical protein
MIRSPTRKRPCRVCKPLSCINKHGKYNITIRNYNEIRITSAIFWKSQMVNSKDGIDATMLFTLRERRRTSASVLSRVRSKVLRRHP